MVKQPGRSLPFIRRVQRLWAPAACASGQVSRPSRRYGQGGGARAAYRQRLAQRAACGGFAPRVVEFMVLDFKNNLRRVQISVKFDFR
jgi:hypothetical protein